METALSLGRTTDPLESASASVAQPSDGTEECVRLGIPCPYVGLSKAAGGRSFSTRECEQTVATYGQLVHENATCGFAVDAILTQVRSKGEQQ